jgi:ketosteroid isomerase-like protein
VSADENTRLIQSVYEAFGRGDLAALAKVMADDIEWVNPGDPDDNPNAGTFRGKEAVLALRGIPADRMSRGPVCLSAPEEPWVFPRLR